MDLALPAHGLIDNPEDLLQKLLGNKQNLVSIVLPESAYFSEDHVDTFLGRMGPEWAMPSLRSILPDRGYKGPGTFSPFRAPVFPSCTAAALMLDRMPNLEVLDLKIPNAQRPLGDALKHVFASVSKLEHLEDLDIIAMCEDVEIDDEWLMQFGNLKSLESILIDVIPPVTVSLTSTQVACFLTDLPKLNRLRLKLGGPQLSCSPEILSTIENAIARMEKIELRGMTFVAEESLATETEAEEISGDQMGIS